MELRKFLQVKKELWKFRKWWKRDAKISQVKKELWKFCKWLKVGAKFSSVLRNSSVLDSSSNSLPWHLIDLEKALKLSKTWILYVI